MTRSQVSDLPRKRVAHSVAITGSMVAKMVATVASSSAYARGRLRFSTSIHPEALEACYMALWQLLRPDFHRLAVDSFRTHRALIRRTLT